MIEIIGKTRVFIIAALSVACGVLGGIFYFYLMPESQNAERNLSAVSAQNATLSADINNIRIEFEQLESQKDQYEQLKVRGFLDRQQRRQIQDVFETVQEQSGVTSANAVVGGAETINDPEAAKAEHVLIQSPVEVTIEALNDIEVFRYIDLLDRNFPGYIAMNEVTITRQSNVDGVLLRAIASGQSPRLVSAKLNFSWTTMIPSEVRPQEGSVVQP